MTQWGAGVHTYNKSEPGLPLGIAPPAAEFYREAIQADFFVGSERMMRPRKRPEIEWPDGKKICATLTVAFEAFTRGGHFKKAKGTEVNLVRSATPIMAAMPASGASSKCSNATRCARPST